MIDASHEIFTAIAAPLREKYRPIKVAGENVGIPAEFPYVAIDETYNIPAHLDTSSKEKYDSVTYRVQVFCTGANRRAQAREIFATVADVCWGLNLVRKTYTTMPEAYNNNIYCISATFEADIRDDGMIYRR